MATFTQTKLHGHQCTLIFTGSHYYLYSSFFGLLGRATRDYNKEGKYPNFASHFTIEAGNRRYSWPSNVIASYFKRLIKREECRYVAKEITFDEKELNCANCILKIEMV